MNEGDNLNSELITRLDRIIYNEDISNNYIYPSKIRHSNGTPKSKKLLKNRAKNKNKKTHKK